MLFIAMRYVQGIDLKALIERDGPLEPDRTVGILRQVAGALDAAHARGLVHRDVKSSNVLVATSEGEEEHAYLSDFGLTKRSASDSGITGTGQFLGTADYAAPEQFLRGKLDGRADEYSLGCVAYECLVGEVPFAAELEVATSSAIPADPNSVLRLDPSTGAPVADITVGADPHGVAFSGRYLWVVNRSDHTISRIDPDTNQVVSTGGGMTGPCNIAPDPGGGVWVTNCLARPYEVDRISPESGQVDERVKVPDVPAGVAFGAGSVWVALLPPSQCGRLPCHAAGTVVRIDPVAGKIIHTDQVGAGAEYVDFGEGALWVGNADDGTVSKIDARTDRVEATIPVGTDPYHVEVGNGFVWVNIRSDHAIYKIDPLRNRVVDIIDGVRGIMTTEGGNLWVADAEAPTLWRIDTDTDQVTAQFDLPFSGFLATGAGSIWLSAPRHLRRPVLRLRWRRWPMAREGAA